MAAQCKLTLLDKDVFLEQLFDERLPGDTRSRAALSRQSDVLFESAAKAKTHVVLVSHWRPSGIETDSGTPTDWLPKHFANVLEINCVCRPRVAAARFQCRRRHPGHEDDRRSFGEVSDWMDGLASGYPLDIGHCICVDTEQPVDSVELTRLIEALLKRGD